MVGTQLLRFGKRPAQICLGLQSGIVIYAGLSIIVLLWLLDHWSVVQGLRSYLAGYEPFNINPAQRVIKSWISEPGRLLRDIRSLQSFLGLYVVLPVFLIGPPTFMMGASFPFLQRAVQDNQAQIGRRVGWLQASNIFGATLGAILVGNVLLHFFGTAWTLRFLIAAGGTFLILSATLLSKTRRFMTITALAITFLLMWSIPSGPVLWAKHGRRLRSIPPKTRQCGFRFRNIGLRQWPWPKLDTLSAPEQCAFSAWHSSGDDPPCSA
jgi:hypothetical protein